MTAQPHALTTALALAGLAVAAGSLPGLAAAQGTTTVAPAGRPAAAAARAPADPAPASNAKATLAQQARSWEDRGRADFAAAAWRKLLAAEPANIDALYGLALAQVNLGQPQAAAEALAALRRARPDHPGLRKLDQHLAQGSTDAGLLKEARRLAAANQYDAAAREYELLLSDRTPQGPIALEYYQTLGGTAAGWEPARRGLERLARSETGDARYALALARHLSYREPSRRDAIRQLAALARSGPGGTSSGAGTGTSTGDAATTTTALSAEQRQEAREAWRQALVWLDAREADQPLYRQFLEAGDDASIRTRLASLQQGLEEGRRNAEARDPAARGRRQAFDALGNGDLAGAAERFQRVLKDKPRDTDALGGLGVVRLREGRLAEARELLGQAVAGSGGAAGPWQKGLQSVDLRLLLQQAELALAQRQPQQALTLARQAAQLDAQEPAAPLAQGEALLELGQPAAAEQAFRQARTLAPASEGAWRGLLRALHAQGRSDAAGQLVDTVDDDAARRLGGRASLGADHLRLSAETLRRRGDLVGAQALLEQALQLDPQAPWVRLALAQLVLAQGQEPQARALMDELQPAASQQTDAWWARAQWHAELNEPQAGLAALDHIAPADRQPEMARLHRRLRVAALVARAQAQAAQGQAGAAQASLQQAQAAAGSELDLLPAIAGAYAELGQGARAQQLLRSALGQDPARAGMGGDAGGARIALQLQYAALLQAGRQDVELAAALAALQGQPMSPAQREQVDGLRLGLALRQVDQLREAGDTAEAYEVLAPLLAERPADSRLKLALARLHASVGDSDTTLETLDTVLMTEPDSLDVWLGAAAIATGLREHDYALAALQRAEAIAPQDSRVLAQYSRHYRARGELGRAAEYMRAAIASQRPAGSTRAGARAGSSAQWGRPLGSANPFAARATPAGAPAGGLGDTEADAAPRRLPPLPGASPNATLPGDAGPRTLPSSEDWLRGGRSERADRLTPAVARTQVQPEPGAGQPAKVVAPAYPAYPAYAAFPTYPAYSAYSVQAADPAATGSAPALTPVDAAGRSAASTPRQSPALRRAAPPVDTDSGAYPTTTDVGSAVGGLAGVPALLAQAGRRLPPGMAEPLPEPQAQPASRPLPLAPPVTARRDATPAPAAASRSLRDELAEIVAERGSREVEGAAALRWRNGEGGMSQLVELRSPINLQVPLGDLGRLQLGLTPTLVDAGTSPTDAEAASRLGSQALGGTPAAANVSGAGVGLRLGLAGRRWSADLGTTPLGFRVLNVVGGVKFGGEFTPQLGYGVELQRRAVTDSVLSYAGMRDPRTGTVWGGVTATGLGGSLQWKDGDLRLGAYAGVAALAGRGVRSNEKLELGATATWRVSDEAQQRVDVGTRIGYQHHTHNLRYYTLGHGGYFSPQHQLALELPVKVVGRDQRLSWTLAATPGLSAWREDAAPYFANDAQAQEQLRARVALGLNTQSSYASRSSFGLSLGLQGGTEYLLSDRLLLGARLSLDSAAQYTQLGAGLYLRLRLDADAVTPRSLAEPAPRHD